MTKVTSNLSSFIVPIAIIGEESADNEALRSLLGGREYIVVGNQILFKQEDQYYLTVIDSSSDYTAHDYQKLPLNAPYQLINGKLEFMPSPYDEHQNVLSNLHGLVFIFLKKHKIGKVRFAPLDVHFDSKNIYQPDLLFISNERKEIIKKFIHGAPDLIVEILSSNKKHDLGKKKEVYGKNNVLEYWAIDYEKRTLDVYLNEEKVLVFECTFHEEDEVQSKVMSGFSFVVGELFEE
ncbi:MAG: Uma2 family endonuclease [Bacteroidota bacterium]